MKRAIQHIARCSSLVLIALLSLGPLMPSAQGQDKEKADVDFDKELEQTTGLIVMIKADFDGVPEFGAGIVFGRAPDRLLIVTAKHVVSKGLRRPQLIQVTFRAAPDKPVTAILLPVSDSVTMDLAFLSVPRAAIPALNPCAIDFNRVGPVHGLKRGDDVYAVGNPHGVAWATPVAPDKVSQLQGTDIVFQSAFISIGHSGGGLVGGDGLLVGMTTGDEPPFGRALDLHTILQAARRWHLPVQLDTTLPHGWTPLHRMALQGDPGAVSRALQDCGDVTAIDEYQATALHMAAAGGDPEVLTILVKAGSNVNARDMDGDSPAEWAIEKGKLEAVKLLVKAGANINEKNNSGKTLLDVAIGQKQTAITDYLISAGAPLNAKNKSETSEPLKEAVYNRDNPTVKQLLAKGARANVNLLYDPVQESNYELAKLLLPATGEINANLSATGNTLLFMAVGRQDPKMAAIILDAGAGVNVVGGARQTALFLAFSETKDTAMERLLLSRGGSFKGTDSLQMDKFMREAVYSGKLEAVRLLLNEKIRPDTRGGDENRYSVLQSAISNKRVAIVRLLVQHGANVRKSPDGTLPLEDALNAGDTTIMRILLDAGAAVTRDMLNAPIRQGDLPVLNLLLDRGVDVDQDMLTTAIEDGNLPVLKALMKGKGTKTSEKELMATAISRNKQEIVQYLLQMGADPSTGFEDAVAKGDLDIVRQLIKAGIDVNKPLASGEAPLHLAVAKERPEVVRLFLETGAKPNVHGNGFLTPLSDAVKDGNIAIVHLLLQAGVSIDDITSDKDTPLLLALNANQTEMARFLIENHASVNIPGNDQYYPLHLALNDDLSLIKLLLDNKANPRVKNVIGETPLHMLARISTTDAVNKARLLLDAGADINAKDNSDKTPLKEALANDNQLVADYLKQHGAK